jgi:hypothetical protein
VGRVDHGARSVAGGHEAAVRRLVGREDVHEQRVEAGPRRREQSDQGEPLPAVTAANVSFLGLI